MARRRQTTRCSNADRPGFTLVELIVVIMIAAILASLSAAAYFKIAANAKVTATEALIAQLDSALRERMDLFFDETRNISPSNESRALAGLATAATPSELKNNLGYRRAIVIERLQAMRECFPQQFSDFLRRPANVADATTGDHALSDPSPSNMDKGRGLGRRTVSMSGRTAILQEYLRRTSRSTTGLPQLTGGQFDPNAVYDSRPLNHDPDTESAACLYLILNTKVAGSTFSIDNVPSQYIRDTDGDGLPEFVDAWGRPLRFYRWPTDYIAYLTDITRQLSPTSTANPLASNLDPEATLTEITGTTGGWFLQTTPVDLRRAEFEERGFFRLHPAYDPAAPNLANAVDATTGANAAHRDEPRAYQLLPLIVSAGPDGKFAFMDPTATPKRAPYGNEMHFRAARINPASASDVGEFGDNISNLLIVSGRRQ